MLDRPCVLSFCPVERNVSSVLNPARPACCSHSYCCRCCWRCPSAPLPTSALLPTAPQHQTLRLQTSQKLSHTRSFSAAAPTTLRLPLSASMLTSTLPHRTRFRVSSGPYRALKSTCAPIKSKMRPPYKMRLHLTRRLSPISHLLLAAPPHARASTARTAL